MRSSKTPLRLQMEAAECGAIALGIILEHHGCYVSSHQLRRDCGIGRDGTTALALIQTAKRYGLDAKGLKIAPSAFTTIPLPAIAFVRNNHFVVIERVTDGHIFINDPAEGHQRLSRADFMAIFSHIILTFAPNDQFKPVQRPAIWRSRLRMIGAWRGLFWITVLGLCLIAPAFIIPTFLRIFMQDVLIGDGAVLPALLIFLSLMVIVITGIAVYYRRMMALIQLGRRMYHTRQFIQRLFDLPMSFFTARGVGDLSNRPILFARLSDFIHQALPTMLYTGVIIGVYATLMVIYDPFLALISSLIAFGNGVFTAWASLRGREAEAVYTHHFGGLANHAAYTLAHIEDVKAIGAENRLFSRLVGLHARMLTHEQIVGRNQYRVQAISTSLTIINTAILLWLASYRVWDGWFSVALFIAFQWLMNGLFAQIAQSIPLVFRWIRLGPEFDRIEDVLHHPTSPTTPIIDEGGNLIIENITFRYSSHSPVLFDGLSMTIAQGEQVAIIGMSGAGKSTLARILAGIYLPERGTVTGMAYLVDQDPFFFAGTWRENITLWDEAISEEAIWTALDHAQLADEVRGLADGLDAPIHEGGGNLSGGQRGRLQIARALARQPRILILDEATASLDPILEARLITRLRQLGMTLVIITHRLHAIRDCDRILVLMGGRVVETGTHPDLMTQNGVYARLVNDDAPLTPPPNPLPTSWRGGMADDSKNYTVLYGRASARPDDEKQTTDKPSRQITSQVKNFPFPYNVEMKNIFIPPTDADAHRTDSDLDRAFRRVTGIIQPFPPRNHRDDEAWLNRLGLMYGWYIRRVDDVTDGYNLIRADEGAYQAYALMPDGAVSLWRMLRFALDGAWADVIRVVGLGMLVALIQLVLYGAIILTFDAFIPLGDALGMGQIIIGMLIGAVVVGICTDMQGQALVRLQSHIEIRLQSAVWGKLLRLPASFFRDYSTGDLTQRMLSVGAIRTTLLALFNAIGGSGMIILLGIPMMFLYAPPLALPMSLFLLILIGISLSIGWMRWRIERHVGRVSGEYQTILQVIVLGMAQWRIFGVIPHIQQVWMTHLAHLQRWTHRAVTIQNRLLVLRDVASAWGILLIIGISALLGDISAGVFIAMTSLMLTLIGATIQWGDALQRLAELLPLHERLHPILSQTREIAPHQPDAQPLTGHIHIENVRFGYDNRRKAVLNDFSLTIGAGEFVALVGKSGCGKSTLMRLLLGFDTPQAGAIYYDDHRLSDVNISSIRAQIGAVLQHQPLINTGTIYQTIAGLTRLSEEAVWDVLALVALADDIRAMPMGLSTRLNDGGLTLSAGQRQRLQIARALAHQPRILFFDEATSALDSTTQRVIRHNLDALGMTRLIIAHRLSTITQADKIIVMDDGKIVEHGRYDDLMRAGGLFAHLAGTFI